MPERIGMDGTDGTERRTPAERALAEAAERRRKLQAAERAKEIDGRDGPDPVRFGDWEVKGRATDF